MAIVAVLAAAAHAADAPAPSPAPPAEDSIAAAKKEYAEIKAAIASPDQQSLAISKQGLGLNLRERNERIAPPPWMSPKELAKQAGENGKKPANWLLDAMDDRRSLLGRPARTAADRQTGTADDDPEHPGLFPTDAAAKAAKEKPARDGDSPLTRDRAGAAANPLATYMAAWMTPGDFALLKPGIAATNANAPGDSLATLSADVGALKDPAGLPGAAPPPGVDGNFAPPDPGAVFSPRQNPYLADLPAVPSPAALAPAPDFPPAPGAPATAATLPALTPAVSLAPGNPAKSDVLKAREDDKYFKQLKRF